jgi:biopolymer transport protein ExbD
MLAAMFSAALCATGCVSTPAPDDAPSAAVHLTLTAAGTLMFDGKPVPPERLASTLRNAGATPDTAIDVDIPADTPRSRVATLTGQLASAGYRKVVFKGPRHAKASVQPKPGMAPKNAPQPVRP